MFRDESHATLHKDISKHPSQEIKIQNVESG